MTNRSLAMFKSDGTRRDFPLAKDRIIIGRKVNCDLRIPLTSVSRQHCEITIDEDSVQVKDLGSSNGTFHNSERVQEASLAAGDELAIGPVVFTLVVDGQPEDIKPIRSMVNGESAEQKEVAVTQAAASSSSSQPEPIAADDLDLPELIEDDDGLTPTVELDDDPIAALESLAAEDDSGEFDEIDFFDLVDDDDDK